MEERKDLIAKVLEKIEKEKVSQIDFLFCGISGILKRFTILAKTFEDSLKDGEGFDGSSVRRYPHIDEFVRVEESDMIAMPDPTTFRILPWKIAGEKIGIVFCDILNPDRSSFQCDSRYILKKALERAKKFGFDHFYVGPEAEYFYIKTPKIGYPPQLLDPGGYFDTIDTGYQIRVYTTKILEKMGIEVDKHHHEVAPSQHEIDLRYKDALVMADQIMIHRWIVKEVAKKFGAYTTFMPKPIFGENGSGMHIHQSLFRGEKNAFFRADDSPYYLSDVGRQYVAGILKYIPEITIILNQWVNSYKRLVVGYEAPVYLTWAIKNRSDLIRIPVYKLGHEEATRIEVRSPDPACNPYLAFAAMLTCGLRGIEEKLDPPPPYEENVYLMSYKERKEKGIQSLPGSLAEAINLASKSKIFWRTVGLDTGKKFLSSKRKEWNIYKTQVHQWELDQYLPIL